MSITTNNMTPWALIADASLLVQLVMLILVIASLASWFLIVQRATLLAGAQRALTGFEQTFRVQNADLSGLFDQHEQSSDGAEGIFRAGYHEFVQLTDPPQAGSAAVMSGAVMPAAVMPEAVMPEAVMEGVQRAMRVAICREEERLGKHLPFLATVGSVSPYIGLFGTVWGIMNSFIGLSQVQQATLAAVAPGIAEALIATAIGLFAAIPAVIAYNRFSAASEQLIHRYYTFAEEFSVVLHRRIHGRPAR